MDIRHHTGATTPLTENTAMAAIMGGCGRLFARSGIGPDTTVVFYGYAPAMGFWLAKLYGHADARILNCARDGWRDEGRPVKIGRAHV